MVKPPAPPAGDLSVTLRALARLLTYPDDALRSHLPDIREALHSAHCLHRRRLASIDALVDALGTRDPLTVEAEHVQWFDSGKSSSLHLFEHVHGDSRDRGPAMVDLARTYESQGVYLREGELPDYLPVVLEFASVLQPPQARSFLAEMAHILNAIHAALVRRGSPHAAVIEAVIELAGERVHPVQAPVDEPVDATWAEPAAFDGCSVRGQAAGSPQPLHFVRGAKGAPGARA